MEQLHLEHLPGATGSYRVTKDPMPTKYGHRLPRNQKERDTIDAELDADPEASRAVDGQRWRLAALKEVSKFQAHVVSRYPTIMRNKVSPQMKSFRAYTYTNIYLYLYRN